MAMKGVGRRLVAGFASRAPVAVFAAVGAGAWDRVDALRLRPRIHLVDSPRHGTVLLVAGSIPARFGVALDRVHDQLAQPRATVWWGAKAAVDDSGGRVAWMRRMNRVVQVEEGTDPEPVLLDLMRALLAGVRAGEEHRLADEPPAPWRGRGDWGQGGEGMMGGVPYGRPMAMTADDIRDGLVLDRLSFTVGPFFPVFPPGLVLRVALQGDVVQSADVVEPPFPQADSQMPAGVPDKEGRKPDAAGARRDLRRAARLLRVAGAGTSADRALRLANAPVPQPGAVRSLRRRLRMGGVLRALPAPRDTAGVDVRTRLLAWLEDAERVLRSRAVAGRGDDVGARGTGWTLPDVAAGEGLDGLSGLLPGLEWGNAMLLINTLNLVPRGPAEAS